MKQKTYTTQELEVIRHWLASQTFHRVPMKLLAISIKQALRHG